MRAFFAFAFTAAASGVLTIALSALDVSPWPMILLFLVVGWSFMSVRAFEKALPSALCFYGCSFVAAFALSLPEVPNPRLAAVRVGVALFLALAATFALAVAFVRSRQAGSGLAWMVLAMSMGVLVGFVSGDAGSAEPMRTFLHDFLPAQVAEAIVWTTRKSVHVCFYGAMAWAVFRAGKSAGTPIVFPALAFATAHGAFDEYRQFAASATRYGNPIDILFDLAGALIFLSFSGAFRKSGEKRASIR